MQGKLRDYIEELLVGMEESEELQEFKYELVMNLCDKIADLLTDGLTEEEAFREAVATLGDLRAVFAERRGYEVDADDETSEMPTGEEMRASEPGAQTDHGVGARKSEKRQSRRRAPTGALFLLGSGVYIMLGLMRFRGGFGVWWVLPIAGLGVGELMGIDIYGGSFLLSIALCSYLIVTGLLSSWWYLLVAMLISIGLSGLLKG